MRVLPRACLDGLLPHALAAGGVLLPVDHFWLMVTGGSATWAGAIVMAEFGGAVSAVGLSP